MDSSIFRFKKFEVSHSRSAMKIGVDGVLIGAWADTEGCRSVLDAGCGCGVIALMCAQRNLSARIDAVDIDADSVEEAADNFRRSPWGERLSVMQRDFSLLSPPAGGYDLIVSNPPYFDSGVKNTDTARKAARHENGFGPLSLLERAAEMLSERGRMAFVMPADRLEEVLEEIRKNHLSVRRIAKVSGRAGKPVKRVLIEIVRGAMPPAVCAEEEFALEEPLSAGPGVPTARYRELCRDFYLRF